MTFHVFHTLSVAPEWPSTYLVNTANKVGDAVTCACLEGRKEASWALEGNAHLSHHVVVIDIWSSHKDQSRVNLIMVLGQKSIRKTSVVDTIKVKGRVRGKDSFFTRLALGSSLVKLFSFPPRVLRKKQSET
jgi:hypothetical protein